MNKVLDVDYLYKRIEFLESAISVLLDEHQLKGIYLTKTNITQAKNHYKRHRMRDKVVKYLFKKCSLEVDEEKKEILKPK